MLKDIKEGFTIVSMYLYVHDNVKGYTRLDSKSESNSIKEYSGFWVHKELFYF